MEPKFQQNLTTQTNLTQGYEWSTAAPLTPEEQDAVVNLIIVVCGIVIAMVLLFAMGVFLDFKHQSRDPLKKKTRLRLKFPRLSHPRNRCDDGKPFAGDMYANGTTQFGAIMMTQDAPV